MVTGANEMELSTLGIKQGGEAFNAEADRRAKLTQLLTGIKATHEADLASQDAAEERALALAGKLGPNYGVGVSKQGVNISEKTAPDTTARDLAIKERHDAKKDRELRAVADRVQKQNIPEALSAAEILEQATSGKEGGMVSNPNYKMKSVGPIANVVRSIPLVGDSLLNVGESLGMMPQGASKEHQAIQRLKNVDIKSSSGSAVSGNEEARKNIEYGTRIGGSPEQARMGVQQILDSVNAQGGNIAAGSNPETVDLFKNQGGALTLSDLIKGPARTSAAPPKGKMSFEEFKALKAAGKL